jgi:hypothetical protein
MDSGMISHTPGERCWPGVTGPVGIVVALILLAADGASIPL